MDQDPWKGGVMFGEPELLEVMFFTEHLGVRVFEHTWDDGDVEYTYFTGVKARQLMINDTVYHGRQDEEHIHDLISEWIDEHGTDALTGASNPQTDRSK